MTVYCVQHDGLIPDHEAVVLHETTTSPDTLVYACYACVREHRLTPRIPTPRTPRTTTP